MREKKEGRIIFTSSGVGVTGFGNISPYASSKGAIESLAKCLEIENQDWGCEKRIVPKKKKDQEFIMNSRSFFLL